MPPAAFLDRARRTALACAAALAAFCSAAPPQALADSVSAVNEARQSACARHQDLAPLRETRELDAAAARIARGASLQTALGMLGARPDYAASIRLTGIGDDRGIARALGSRFCADLSMPALREVGIARAGSELYILVTAPLPLPSPGSRGDVERALLKLVNETRARPRRCGPVSYAAAPALALSPLLSRVANEHSAAMAARQDLGHDDPDGSTPADRVRRAHYPARLVGENVASGVPTAAEAVAGWLASPGHCANIMDRRFTEMGVAYVVVPHRTVAIYWTQLFAVPRT